MRYSLYAEMKKIRFSRFSRLYLIMTIALSVLVGLLFSLTTNVTQSRALEELKPMEVITVNMLGVDVKGGTEDIGIIVALIVLLIWSLIACALAVWSLSHKDI